MIKTVRAKLHGLRVTGADLDYHGSISLDPEICRLAGLYPLEFVYIWNKNNGQRLSTYIIPGVPGSRCCILNGAAARCCQKGDEVIICAVDYLLNPDDLTAHSPRVLIFNDQNEVIDRLQYTVTKDDDGFFDFNVLSLENNF
ncbi:MAG: aspartate 1-decarboxylase [Candidatus Adiutrix sp.]|jgi:aspartate 1-decarboxylase|nr:aspartate 1-decarboxylase [Candidatus Adiutrix sp.]